MQKSVKSRLGHRLRRQQESWEMTQQEDQRKYEQRRSRSIIKGWTKKYKSVLKWRWRKKEKASKSALPWKPRGEFRRD